LVVLLLFDQEQLEQKCFKPQQLSPQIPQQQQLQQTQKIPELNSLTNAIEAISTKHSPENTHSMKKLIEKINALNSNKILSQTAIRQIATKRPKNFFELALIKGVGRDRASIIGHKILNLLQES